MTQDDNVKFKIMCEKRNKIKNKNTRTWLQALSSIAYRSQQNAECFSRSHSIKPIPNENAIILQENQVHNNA